MRCAYVLSRHTGRERCAVKYPGLRTPASETSRSGCSDDSRWTGSGGALVGGLDDDQSVNVDWFPTGRTLHGHRADLCGERGKQDARR